MPIMGPNGPMDPGAMDAGQMANMPVDGFAGATAGDMAAMPPQAMGGMNADMMGNMPCLLYTSPSPRDMRRSRMPSSA